MPLKDRLIEQIVLDGPMTVADYVQRCLLDPLDGYYSKHVRLGADGDFITAPLVSQMFGEMIGVWAAEVWRGLGSPPQIRLVEIGPGDGTLMTDLLRVLSRISGLAVDVVLIEPSEPLRVLQAINIPNATFVHSLDHVETDLPLILIANEVLDCLPARQFVRISADWFERVISQDKGELRFGLVPGPDLGILPGTPEHAIFEISHAQLRLAGNLAGLLKAARGAALLIDYGRDSLGTGDTLQALYRHTKTDPLAAPGEHDITMWADFPAVATAAERAGVKVSPIVSQAAFLQELGIDLRLRALQDGNPDSANKLQRQYERLMSPDQMGELFKVLALAWPHDLAIPALEANAAQA